MKLKKYRPKIGCILKNINHKTRSLFNLIIIIIKKYKKILDYKEKKDLSTILNSFITFLWNLLIACKFGNKQQIK